MEIQNKKQPKTILKKNKAEELTLPDFKIQIKAV